MVGYTSQLNHNYCPDTLQHLLPEKDIDISQFNRTDTEVTFDSLFTSEIFTTWTAAKVFDVWVFQCMRSQFTCCTETLWTVSANIRLHTFMTTYMFLKVTFLGEFLLTNVTYEPSTFIVWLQQMCLKMAELSKTFWTVSTWVRLCTSVSVNMKFQIAVTFKQLPTPTTVIRSSVAVYITFMFLQSVWSTEAFVTQWTLVWFVSRVYSHMNV